MSFDIRSLVAGQAVSGVRFGVVSRVEKKTNSGAPYEVMELSHTSGLITGKVWNDARIKVAGEPGEVVEIEASVDEYRGIFNFNVQRAKVVEEEFDAYLSPKPTMVFDIETVGKDWKELDTREQEYIETRLEKDFEGTKTEMHARTGLYPLYGKVVAIAMCNPLTSKGAVYYVKSEKSKVTSDEIKIEGFSVREFENEKALLEAFWEAAAKYHRFVTFNGTRFDWPYLSFRSAVHRVRVPFEIPGGADTHVDLAYKFRMNNRQFRLEMICRALGISNPKDGGVSGAEVGKLYAKGELGRIAEYVAGDVKSTCELYEVWRRFVAGRVVV